MQAGITGVALLKRPAAADSTHYINVCSQMPPPPAPSLSMQYGVRRSTKAVYGICYPSDATGVPTVQAPVPWPFTVYTSTLKLLDVNTLQQTLATLPPYEDLLGATASGVKPGRQETIITYRLEAGGKTVMSTKVNAFDVNPDTLEARFAGTQEPGLEHQVSCNGR